jgi:hypothetical protein
MIERCMELGREHLVAKLSRFAADCGLAGDAG